MSSGDWKGGCPNCSCALCKPAQYARMVGETECAFDRIARDYAARGIPIPTGWLLVCDCKRCKPITF